MARIARIVIPGLPHHVTQRGNRREQVFFSDHDHEAYIGLLAGAANDAGSEVWAWCLMLNHVHMIVVPRDEDGLRKTVANAHRRYAARINARNQWTGHLWQGRFGSAVMDEAHLYHAIAYVSLNPVRARLVKRAEDWRWSSVHDHLAGRDGKLTTVAPVLERVGDFAQFLAHAYDETGLEAIRKSEVIGRPLGDTAFVEGLEAMTGRTLMAQKRGRKRESKAAED